MIVTDPFIQLNLMDFAIFILEDNKEPENPLGVGKGKTANGRIRMMNLSGENITVNGYRKIRLENGEWMLEHAYIMSQHIKRPLLKGETVHHKNGNKLDNRLDNLELWSSSHPNGQRISDLVVWAKEILALYG